jgi:hypothetical protein
MRVISEQMVNGNATVLLPQADIEEAEEVIDQVEVEEVRDGSALSSP